MAKLNAKVDVTTNLLSSLAEIGDFTISHQAWNKITKLQFVDLMPEDEYFIGDNFYAVLKTAANFGKSKAWLDVEIETPEFITKEISAE